MPEDAPVEGDQTQEAPAKPPTLEESLAGLDETTRKAVLDTVSKARKGEAEYRRKLREAEPLITAAQQAAEAGKSEADKAREAEVAAEKRITAYRDKLVSATVRALATARFNDPTDAEVFMDLGSFVDADGNVDEIAVSVALDELLEGKPHLGKPEPDSGFPRRPAPDLSQGAGAGVGSSALNGDQLLGAVKAKLGIR